MSPMNSRLLVPTQPRDPFFGNVTLLLRMDGDDGSTNFFDLSQFRHTVTPVGDAQISTIQSKFGGSSAYINNSGDYLSLPNETALALTSSDFTMEFWLYKVAYTGSAQDTIIYWNGNAAAQGAVRLAVLDALGTVRLYSVDSDGTQHSATSSTAMTFSQWQHYAIVRSGGSIVLYMDGNSVATITLPTVGTSLTNGTTNWIGNLNFSPGSWYLDGFVDSFRLTKEVARYTEAFTPPQGDFPA